MARSALTLMEHVNLNVPDPAKAEAFFVDALGGVKNPKSSNNTQVHCVASRPALEFSVLFLCAPLGIREDVSVLQNYAFRIVS